MTPLLPINDLDAYIAKRTSWHALGEHVVTKARWQHTNKIGLRAHPGGFATPHFSDDQRVFDDGSGIHREKYGDARCVPITTLRAAASFVGVEAGAPSEIFTASTALDLDALLPVDSDASRHLGAWFEFGAHVLSALRSAHGAQNPSLVQLWPEHFDLAVDIGDECNATRANFGASPGDAAIPAPYLYVGPWDMSAKSGDPFWNQPWGTALHYDALCAAPDPIAAASSFFEHGYTRL